jgi:uncharacterized protein YfaS (alpha-2-macroglobulin family)
VLHEAEALKPALESQLKALLLHSQKNGYWLSTYDTAQVIFNSRYLLSKEAEAANKAKAQGRGITVSSKNGFALGNSTSIPGGYLGEFSRFGEQPDVSDITLADLKAEEVASASLSVDTPYAAVSAHAAGLQVERRFRKITATGSELIDFSQNLHPGDVIVSEIQVKRAPDATRPALGSEYVVIEDGVPAIAESQENDQTYLADAKIQAKQDDYWSNIKETQRYPDRTVRVAKLLPGGEFHLYQVWRIARSGTAAIPPATAFDMYNEAVQGNSLATRINVTK